jgi:hypothetical protein
MLLTLRKKNDMKKYILLLFFGAIITLNAQDLVLKVLDIRQEQTNWCWAASSSCVLDYYGYPQEQCEIAEYARIHSVWHNYGLVPCCEDASQGCNKGGLACFEEDMMHDILMNFGNIGNNCTGVLSISQIQYNLKLQRPFLIRRVKGSTGHFVVGYGLEGSKIWYMDPTLNGGGYKSLPYDSLKNNGMWKWEGSNVLLRSPFPDHCYDCKLNGDEVDYDCGGACPPCKLASDEVQYITPTNNLPLEVRATKKITAGNAAVKVLSGQNVNFITAGEIVLLPGFEVAAGANFNTQIKNNTLNLKQICGKYCEEDRYGPIQAVRHQDIFSADHLVNVDRIEYKIHNLQSGRLIYENIIHINDYGTVDLWDLIEGESSNPPSFTWYVIYVYVYPCDGGAVSEGSVKFSVSDFKKSSSDDTEETEIPDIFLSHSSNNLPLQDETPIQHFSIIPNPNPGAFQLETNFPLSDIGHLKITNLLGVTVYESKNLATNTIQLPASISGQHFVVVNLKDGTVLTQKMMIHR